MSCVGTGALLTIPIPELSGQIEQVTVVQVKHPADFWIRINKYSSVLDSVKTRMLSYCNEPYASVQWCVNVFAAAKSNSDGHWYRALLLKAAAGNSIFEVLLVDEGRCEMINLTNLRLLKPEFFQTPRLAIHCKLASVRPFGSSQGESWMDRSIATFRELVELGEISCTFFKLIAHSDCYSVALTDSSSSPSIASILVRGNGAELDIDAANNDELSGLKARNYPILDMRGMRIHCLITTMSSLRDFYVQDKIRAPELCELNAELAECTRRAKLLLVDAKEGDICLTQLHRAKVLKASSTDYNVLFVDYGTNAIVERSQCHPLFPYLAVYNVFAHRCSIVNVELIVPNSETEALAALIKVSHNQSSGIICEFQELNPQSDIYNVHLKVWTPSCTYSLNEYFPNYFRQVNSMQTVIERTDSVSTLKSTTSISNKARLSIPAILGEKKVHIFNFL